MFCIYLPVWVRTCLVKSDGRSNAFGHISHCHIRRSFCLLAIDEEEEEEETLMRVVFVSEWSGVRLLFVDVTNDDDDDDARIWSIINDMMIDAVTARFFWEIKCVSYVRMHIILRSQQSYIYIGRSFSFSLSLYPSSLSSFLVRSIST